MRRVSQVTEDKKVTHYQPAYAASSSTRHSHVVVLLSGTAEYARREASVLHALLRDMGLAKKQCMQGQCWSWLTFWKIKSRKKLSRKYNFQERTGQNYPALWSMTDISAPKDTVKVLKSVACDSWVGLRSSEMTAVYRMLKLLQDKPFHNLPLLWKIN